AGAGAVQAVVDGYRRLPALGLVIAGGLHAVVAVARIALCPDRDGTAIRAAGDVGHGCVQRTAGIEPRPGPPLTIGLQRDVVDIAANRDQPDIAGIVAHAATQL